MINIRQASEADAEILAELNRFVHEIHRDRMPERCKPAETGAISEWFRSMIKKPAVRAWIAESEGSAAGYVLAAVHHRPETPFRYGRVIYHLEEVAVAPEFRRKGVARALIERVVADARAKGAQEIDGDSWFFNTGSHDLLRALGFHTQIIRFSRTIS